MTDSFSTYDEATQRHILELGCFIYNKSLEHHRENHPTTAAPTAPVSDANTVHLKQQLENLSTRVFEVREEEYKKGEAKVAEYKQQLAAERQRLDNILATIQSDTDRQITVNDR
jgi:hypothetical protein